MKKIFISIIIILIIIYIFGFSYAFGGGWEGIGNSLFIIVNYFFSLRITYIVLKKFLGKTKMEDMGSLSSLLILILAIIPFWFLMKFNPFM